MNEKLVEMIQFVIATNEFQTFFKLLLITILSGIIGFERENSSKPAGFRTHALVGISATLVMILGAEIAESFGNNDPSRMPAQLLSGIGFVGAGTILRDGFNVKGLTTAAGLLAVTCIGMAVGAELYVQAIIATLIVYIVLTYSYKVFSKLDHMPSINIKVSMNNPKEHIEKVKVLLNHYKLEINKVKIVEDDDASADGYVLFECKAKTNSLNKNNLLTELVKLDPVTKVTEV